MGCSALGGTKGVPDKKPSEDVSNPPIEESTWATKTVDMTPAAGSSTPVTSLSPKATSNENGLKLVMRDADDDDDDIEIIYNERAPIAQKQQVQQAHRQQDPQLQMRVPSAGAANGQEPPEATEPDRRAQQKEEKPAQAEKPLSKAQQEEAAKLAEKRKKFDQRWQQDQPIPDLGSVKPNEVIAAAEARQKSASPPPKMNKPMEHSYNPLPSSDMIMGLNQVQGNNQHSQPDAWGGGLPGGILDDIEPFKPVAAKKNQNHSSGHFNDDDEQLMADILQDLDDFDL